MSSHRWTDTFLNQLRQEGDPLADKSLKKLTRDDELRNIRKVFSELDSNNDVPPSKTFPELNKFFQATNNIPSYVDIARIFRGERIFQKNAFTGALVLLTKSLPEGYAAPNLSIILNLSGDLRVHPYKRLLATLQTVVNVSAVYGFRNSGRAVITAQKLRLLHAGIRHLTRRYRPDFELRYGIPVNQEDMLGTIMGFSFLVIEGMRTLEIGLTADEEEDFFYVWRVFAHMMGIHPPDRPDSLDYIPENVGDADAFYQAYRRRHYVDAVQNPNGVALATANLKMLEDFVPGIFRFLGLGILPRMYMQDLMGVEQCNRIGIKRVPAFVLVKWLLTLIPFLWRPLELLHGNRHERFGSMIFQYLIDRAYNGEVTFTVPKNMREMKDMIKERGTDPVPQAQKP